ncbi:hypothetical protein [Natronorarus salvus]|uniref:hypothetical protein n=1 Tax=Natronorarus salvus TaxID=3117733 RepID=UPI002F26BA93
MPIQRSDWQDGPRRESRYHHIVSLLEMNQDKAYSISEIADHVNFTMNANRSLIRDRLGHILVASMLDHLAYDGTIEAREAQGENHYSFSLE